MTLKEQINGEILTAMKAREVLKLDTLRMLKADVIKYEVSGADKVATDEVVIDLVKKGIKQRKEASTAFDKGGKADLAQKELDEIKILETYMPEQMNEDQVKVVVQEVLDQTGASGPTDFGKVMGATMGKLKGQADGALVGKVVKELLG